ncbi:DNA-binding transcriptional ArsR family regulator [Thermocatellispora tengchongensis]|uniref:DNA-binding transcriptional ArsR family regulator n=1 Tax=Thermocatellispora tengchongensis TaxID=1073253 RepID=A0A840P4I4_9ACTN|nr:helix-turn-helix domain-containing protein [Thermocatellispora tengchongensis]MBB5132390.1 DNA-binding transcriptional ArsR family regulator [Thermocatellispora tengchongensis]
MAGVVEVVRGEGRLRGGLSPLRRRLLEELREPASASALAERLGEKRQRVNYHLRELEKSGLVELVELRPRRGFTERVVRATARAVVVQPEVAGDLEGVSQDRFAVDMLLAAAARTLGDVAAMRERAEAAGKRLVTFTIEADVGFERPADIERFAAELTELVAGLAEKYESGRDRHRYRIVVGGHPAGRRSEEES